MHISERVWQRGGGGGRYKGVAGKSPNSREKLLGPFSTASLLPESVPTTEPLGRERGEQRGRQQWDTTLLKRAV